MSQCRCSPYKVTAHRLKTKDVPELEHNLRESDARIDELTVMLHAANHKYDDVTRPLIAEVAELTAQVKAQALHITKRDEKIAALQTSLQEQGTEQQKAQALIFEMKRSIETLTSNMQKLVRSDICQAAKQGELDLVALWLSLGCDVNKRDPECVRRIVNVLTSIECALLQAVDLASLGIRKWAL
jgi:hypothetical protein